MYTSQAGIFALGTSSHAYLEFDLLDAKKCKEFASAVSAIREPRTTTGGVNFVIGFRPELWRDIVPDDAPPGVEGFNKEIQGTEGFVMPSTQHDALVWLSGSAYDVVFDMARSVIHDLASHIEDNVVSTAGQPYQRIMLRVGHHESFCALDLFVKALHTRRGVIRNDIAPELRPKADDEVHSSGSGPWFTDSGDGRGELPAFLCFEKVKLQVRVRRGSKSEDSSLRRIHAGIISSTNSQKYER